MFNKTHNPKRNLLLILTFFILNSAFYICTATVRYVSHSGSNTPPYTTWETSADSIMSAINISVFGDTIYVANGVYEEQVIMIPGLGLIGAGMDSCIIDTRNFVQPVGFTSVIVADSSVFKGFQVIVANSRTNIAIKSDSVNAIIESNKLNNATIGVSVRFSNTLVANNILQNFTYGTSITNSESLISNNQFINVERGVRVDAFTGDYYPIVEQNMISCTSFGIIVQFNSSPAIRNNIIFLNGDFARGYSGGGSDSVWIYNNVIIAEDSYDHADGLSISRVPAFVYNNLVMGDIEKGISCRDFNIIKNNLVLNAKDGIKYIDSGNQLVAQYNNAWNNDINYSGFTPDSTNLSVDPMIVNDDSTQGDLDFHLQMFSPLIDAGDPNILDIDGSRSDIGLFGGPFGESYTYQDLAPKPPRNLIATLDSNIVTLNWLPNTEADFLQYRVYRDTSANFILDTTKLVTDLSDTTFNEVIPLEKNLYYKITAVDSQHNESPPSEEVSIIIVGVEEPELIANDYMLFQNYPNPFNPLTTISYRLKEKGYVKLMVYDIRGELVSVLVNKVQEAGYYEVEFSGVTSFKKKESLAQKLASGIYIYQIMIRNNNDIPIYSGMKKMILLK